ncbi:MAG: DUF167 domain-containing protein [Chloroflexota bacterium]|nr:DUF167 domain-containing protein [Chloroflexota bacterium]
MNSARQPAQSVIHHPDGCVISLTVSPRSPANRIAIDEHGAIRIRLTAPPVDGAANAGLLKFLASLLDVPRSSLTIVAGAQARHKRLLVEGMSAESAWKALSRAAGLKM